MKYGRNVAHENVYFFSMTITKQRAWNLQTAKHEMMNSCKKIRQTKLLPPRAQKSIQNKFLADHSIRVSLVTLEDRFAEITGDRTGSNTISMYKVFNQTVVCKSCFQKHRQLICRFFSCFTSTVYCLPP